jgi:hypothetical protein
LSPETQPPKNGEGLAFLNDFSRWKFLLIFQLNVKIREFGARKTPITRNLVVLQDKGR